MRWHNFMHVQLKLVSFVSVLLLLVLSSTSLAHAQADPTGRSVPATPAIQNPGTGALSREGIFGCLGQGARVANVGTLSAIGGVYVPVNDAAVTLNTGYLVYKECVLDGVSRRVAENATVALAAQTVRGISTGRNGEPQWSVNKDKEFGERALGVIVTELETEEEFSPMCQAFRSPVRRALARSYAKATSKAATSVTCPLPGTTAQRSAEDQAFTYDLWFGLIEPTGNPLGAYLSKQAEIDAEIARDNFNTRETLLASNNIYPIVTTNRDPRRQNIVTPGYLIASTLSQVSGSGFRQIETANEIDQMVENMWGAFGTSISTSATGVLGATLSSNGQASYIDRMSAAASAGLREAAVNAAIGILAAAREIEAVYRQAKQATANVLTGAIQELRAMENTCWGLIVPKVQEKASSEGRSLRIATSTAFSQEIIDAQIQPLADSVLRELEVSTQTVQSINQLIAAVTNNSSPTNQRAALERLDALVASGQLHSPQQAQNANKQKDDVATALATLLSDTRTAWGDSTDPQVGWCNINNAAVIDRWYTAWRI